jgi:hypothetical protein
MPNLQNLLSGRRLVLDALRNGVLETERATLTAIDACLGVAGLPQSATGQSVLLTGANIPAEIGYHYGPKPNPEVAAFLKNGTIFNAMQQRERRSALLNAYPPAYFQAVNSGRRLYSAIPQAVVNAGLSLKTANDLQEGNALAADFTAQGWRTHLKMPSTPQLTPAAAGARLAELALDYQFSMFEFWLSDYAGHQQDMAQAVQLLESFDLVMGGLVNTWNDERGLILITSDHGNLEDISTRRHTANPVPALVIGEPAARRAFIEGLNDLTGIAPRILNFFSG